MVTHILIFCGLFLLDVVLFFAMLIFALLGHINTTEGGLIINRSLRERQGGRLPVLALIGEIVRGYVMIIVSWAVVAGIMYALIVSLGNTLTYFDTHFAG